MVDADEYSKIDADILSILKTAWELKQAKIPMTYKMIYRRSGVPVQTMFRYINDPKYNIDVVAKKFGYQIKIFKKKKRGRIIEIVKVGVSKQYENPQKDAIFDLNNVVIDS